MKEFIFEIPIGTLERIPRRNCYWNTPEKLMEKIPTGALEDTLVIFGGYFGEIPGGNLQINSLKNPRRNICRKSSEGFLNEFLDEFPGGIAIEAFPEEFLENISGGNLRRSSLCKSLITGKILWKIFKEISRENPRRNCFMKPPEEILGVISGGIAIGKSLRNFWRKSPEEFLVKFCGEYPRWCF